MKAAVLSEPLSAPEARPSAATFGRLSDYVALTKPRIAVLVLFTVGAGVLLASAPALPLALLFHAVVGTALVASGASALNQWLERHTDGLMRRTRRRPLPAGRLQPLQVFAFGMALGAVGVAYLAVALPTPAAAVLAGITFVLYVAVYTPLKTRTTLNTLVGAVPGALPPVIGWAAARGEVGPEAVTLFVVLFFWQVPHFLAIAWIYKDEYAGAGLCMLPGADGDGELTARHMVLYCLALICASLAPVLLGAAGWPYLAGALLLGLYFLASTLRFGGERTTARARQVLRASLVYLPGLLAALVADRALAACVLGQ